MFKHYFEQINGVDIWPLISFIFFFIFFIGLTIWVIRARKEDMDEKSKLPLDDNNIESRSLKNQVS